MTAQAIEQQIERRGIPIAQFQPGANALIAYWPQLGASKIGGVLPLNDGAALANLGVRTEPLHERPATLSRRTTGCATP